ncbi:hypothetical protein PAMP_014087 [Pampus punctatissimus]
MNEALKGISFQSINRGIGRIVQQELNMWDQSHKHTHAHPGLMAPAAGVSEALTVAPCRVALASALCQFHRVGAGGVCGQQATGKL